MNHRLLIATLLALLGMAIYAPLPAQQPGESNLITIKLSAMPTDDDDQPTTLPLAVQGEGITIEGVAEAYAADRSSYKPTALEIKIRGAVKSIRCDYANVLSAMDITSSKTIELLNVKNSGMTDLQVKGVTSLQELICARTSISALDLTGCTGLTKLEANSCMKLTSVTLTGCTALEEIQLQNGEIKALDLSGLTKVKRLQLERNPLATLQVAGLTKLMTLNVEGTKLTALSLSDCTALEMLTASRCGDLATIQLPKTGQLQYLYLSDCKPLQTVDLTGLTGLKEAYLERNKALTKVIVSDCPNLKLLSLYLSALPAEATLAIVNGLADHSANYDAMKPAFKIYAKGVKFDYTEANVWSPKAASLARRKGWTLYSKNDNDNSIPKLLFSDYAKVSIEKTEHGKVALEGLDAEDLALLPVGETYKVVATPDEGYQLETLKLNDEDIIKDMQFDLMADGKVTATFAKGSTYQYYLTKVEPSKPHPDLCTYTYEYDDNKQWISRTETKADGSISQHNSISYDTKGRISDIATTISTDYDGDGKPSMFAHFTYDDQGHMTGRQMKLYDKLMANYKILYRPDGQVDYWVDETAQVMSEYIYNDKGQLIEEQFGRPDLSQDRPTITTVSGKTFYTYNEKGQKSEVKSSAAQFKWRYFKGETYKWDNDGLLTTYGAMNYEYKEGEKDADKGVAKPVYELRFQYAPEQTAKVFWPKRPFTEGGGTLAEFLYELTGNCQKAEYWSLSDGKEKHFLDFVYTFEASPRHIQELVDRGTTTVQYAYGTITAEGASLEGLQIYDTTGQLLRDYRTAPCQRIDMGVSELPDGLYIVRSISSDSTQTDKVVITQ